MGKAFKRRSVECAQLDRSHVRWHKGHLQLNDRRRVLQKAATRRNLDEVVLRLRRVVFVIRDVERVLVVRLWRRGRALLLDDVDDTGPEILTINRFRTEFHSRNLKRSISDFGPSTFHLNHTMSADLEVKCRNVNFLNLSIKTC